MFKYDDYIYRENIIKGNLDETCPKLNVELKGISLKNHQQTLLYAMNNLENNKIIEFENNEYLETNIGILSDKTGSGKSISILALILYNKSLNSNINTKEYKINTDVIKYYKNKININLPVNLIILNKILINQWVEYIKKYTDLKYCIILEQEDTKKDIDFYKEFDIILCYHKMYNELSMRNFIWSRVIFDDIDTLNITKSNIIHSNFIWFISSNVLNLCFPNKYYKHNGWIKKIPGISNNGFIKDILTQLLEIKDISKIFFKNKESYINNSYTLPEPIINYIICDTPIEINILNNVVSKNIIEMLNAGDKFGALKELGFTVDNTSEIIELILKDINNELNNLLLEKGNEEINKRIIDLENKKNEIISRIINEDICLLCADKIKNKVILKCCNNSFDFECIQKLNYFGINNCPYCRADIKKDTQLLIKSTNENCILKTKEKTTLNIIIDKLNREPNSIFLLFNDYDASLEYLKDIFDKNKIDYNKITGRYSINDKSKVFLLNSKYFGSGLNLEFATDIIIYHRMDKEFENQIIGRSQRLGRIQPLTIHYLYYQNEII